jgi:Trypsin-like peptidase domain
MRLIKLSLVAAQMLACLAVATGLAADDGPSAEMMQQIARSVVQIVARDCTSGNRTGSGFVWSNPSSVVTALHVVAGCRSLAAYNQGVGEIGVHVAHALPSADLALLGLDHPGPGSPLAVGRTTPQPNDTLQVIGFYYGVPTLDNRPLRVTIGSPILRDMLPDQVRRNLQQTEAIDLGTQIVRVDGHLVPGLSGAPLVNGHGEVVGIGSGGLENGLAGIAWAVQARYLDDLGRAPAPATLPNLGSSSVLFSAPAIGDRPQVVRCGTFNFARSKVRTLGDVLKTTDDPAGFAYLATTAGIDVQQLLGTRLAVYSETSTGASVAVPEQTYLRVLNDDCTASFNEIVNIRLTSKRVTSPADIQNQSAAFEQSFSGGGLTWFPNPAFTYSQPLQRADGFIVRRKSWVGFMGAEARGVAFETLLAKRNIFVGVQVHNHSIDQQAWSQCSIAPADTATCANLFQVFDFWKAALSGAHLSTIPPS